MTTHPVPTITKDLDLLRADLMSANFTVDGVGEVLGGLANEALHREQTLPALRALAGNEEPTATLIKLFVLGQPVTYSAAAAAFGKLTVTGAQAMNLVAEVSRAETSPEIASTLEAAPTNETARTQENVRSVEDELGTESRVSEPSSSQPASSQLQDPREPMLKALIEIHPHGSTDSQGSVDWWLASDLSELATGGALQSDHVLGAGGASLTLAQVTARTPVSRVLDLGTGSGIQALYAARHAQEIVATDLSARALEFARFNAALNEITLDLREGSMLEPVAGERFDLVVSNPPFVITPRTEEGDVLPQYEYRDGGAAGDDIVHNLIVDLGGVLNPGGSAYLLGNWEIQHGQQWHTRISQWLDEAEAAHGPLDAWVIQRELLDPARYAETWIRDGGTTEDRDPQGYAATYSAWLDDFASRSVEAIGFGIVVLRKPAVSKTEAANHPQPMRRLEEATGTVAQPLGPVIAASIAAHDWVSALTDQELAQQRLVVASDVTEERFYTPGAQDPNIIIIRQGHGFGRAIQAGTTLAGLVGACDGELTVGQILGAITMLFEVDLTELATELFPDIRGLVTDGLLVGQ
ncbi:methyltransferase [Jonesiaceae bacterium BS-20]|uniref:Methyltransferase n=1 Tax=Jonesiaceae bacterium BS-20 TaxID=3120821 RepID=A0AAU7DW13_9MICO